MAEPRHERAGGAGTKGALEGPHVPPIVGIHSGGHKMCPPACIPTKFQHHFDDPFIKTIPDALADLSALQLSQRVLKPTHEKGHLLDPVFSNLTDLICPNPIPIPWSDHHIIHLLWSPK